MIVHKISAADMLCKGVKKLLKFGMYSSNSCHRKCIMAACLEVAWCMQVYEEHNITARPHNSLDDQQMCDLLVQILDNEEFCPDNFIETIMLDILDDEYEGNEHTDQPPDSKEGVPVSHQMMTSSHHIHIQRRGLLRVLKWRTENMPYDIG
jgi:hypothetical protein